MPSQIDATCAHTALVFGRVLAQSIALISPTMTAALIVPLMFGTSGKRVGSRTRSARSCCCSSRSTSIQFAKRSSHTGSMFLYSVAGLGPTAGGLAGWCLIWAYMFIGTAGVTGFTIFAQQLLGDGRTSTSRPISLFALCAAVCWYCAYKDVRLSAILMLVLEAVSVALITLLGFRRARAPRFRDRHRPALAERQLALDARARRRGRHLQLGRIRGRDRVRRGGEEPAEDDPARGHRQPARSPACSSSSSPTPKSWACAAPTRRSTSSRRRSRRSRRCCTSTCCKSRSISAR